MSFSLTTPQFKARTKDVTRRMGWDFLHPGDLLMGVEKGMGLKRGEKIVRLGAIRVVSMRREALNHMLRTDSFYGTNECRREGFPNLCPAEFVQMFCASHKGCRPETVIVRIQFEYVDDNAEINPRSCHGEKPNE